MTECSLYVTSNINQQVKKLRFGEHNDMTEAVADQQYVPLGARHIFAAPRVQYFISLYRTGTYLWHRPELN